MSRKIKNNINIVKNQTLLLIDNIKVVNNLISINLKKKNFCIPCRFISYKNNNIVKINVDVNFKNILKKDNVYDCYSNLLNIIDEISYDYFLKGY